MGGEASSQRFQETYMFHVAIGPVAALTGGSRMHNGLNDHMPRCLVEPDQTLKKQNRLGSDYMNCGNESSTTVSPSSSSLSRVLKKE